MSTNSVEVSSQLGSHEILSVCFEFRIQTPSQLETLFCLVTIVGGHVYTVDSPDDQIFLQCSRMGWEYRVFMPASCSLALPGSGMVEEAKEKREDTYIPYSAE